MLLLVEAITMPDNKNQNTNTSNTSNTQKSSANESKLKPRNLNKTTRSIFSKDQKTNGGTE